MLQRNWQSLYQVGNTYFSVFFFPPIASMPDVSWQAQALAAASAAGRERKMLTA